MNCPNCNTELDVGAKYCSECGTKIPVRKKINGAGVSIGDKNVIAGDVSITNVNAQDETKLVNECHVCGKHVTNDHGHTCPVCGQFTCHECFDKKKKMCDSCAKEKHKIALDEYQSFASKIYAKGVISADDRDVLEKKAKSLDLTSEETDSVENCFRNESVDLTDAEKIALEDCQKILLKGGKFGETEKITRIYEEHPNNPDVLACYVRMIAKSDGFDHENVEKWIKQLNHDNPVAQMTLAEFALINKDFSKANRLIEVAKKKWPSDYLVTCYEIILYCFFVNKKQRFEYLTKIQDALSSLGEPSNIFEESCGKFTKFLCDWIGKWKDGEDGEALVCVDFDASWKNLWSIVDFSKKFLEKKNREERKRQQKILFEMNEREQKYEKEKRKQEEEKKLERRRRKKRSIAMSIPFGFLIPTIIIEGIVFALANLISISEIWLYTVVAIICFIIAIISIKKEKIIDKLLCHLFFWGPFVIIEALSIGVGYLIITYCLQSLLLTIIYTLVAVLSLFLGLKYEDEACDEAEKALSYSAIAFGIICIVELIVYFIFGEVEFWTVWLIPFSILSFVIAGIVLKEFLEKHK